MFGYDTLCYSQLPPTPVRSSIEPSAHPALFSYFLLDSQPNTDGPLCVCALEMTPDDSRDPDLNFVYNIGIELWSGGLIWPTKQHRTPAEGGSSCHGKGHLKN